MQMGIIDGRVGSVLFPGDVFDVGALFEAQRMGVSVPDQIEICGIGNYEIGKCCVPALSTVSMPSKEIGCLAVDACFGNIGNVCLEAGLLQRQSTRF